MSNDMVTNLDLPKRFEILKRRAEAAGLQVSEIVEKIDNATTRVETLLRQVQTGGIGRFEIFYGESGSGKTTFLSTLPRFFDGVKVHAVSRRVPLVDVPEHILGLRSDGDPPTVYFLTGFDHPRQDDEELEEFFDKLRIEFRETEGNYVLIWPITDKSKVQKVADAADRVGKDSLVDLSTGGIYHFTGLESEKFQAVADITVRSLTGGEGLESFGLTPDILQPIADSASTIAEFYTHLEAKSAELNGLYRDLLKERVVPKLWILLAGDENKDLDLTVKALTQGTHNLIDIDLMLEYLDNPELDAAYLKSWMPLRGKMAHLMRMLDVRLIELPANVALAAARAHGDTAVRAKLNLGSTTPSSAAGTLRNAKFYRLATGARIPNNLLKKTREQTAQEYLRLQQDASKADKSLNKALAGSVEYTLNADGHTSVKVESEKAAPDSNLQPDVRIEGLDARPIHLEVTWRSTGAEVPNEVAKQQNTLTPGHLRVYILEKVLSYVQDLGLA